MLEARALTKEYGANRAVDGATFQVLPGQVVGLVGNNGAGKSTTLKMLCGLVEPTSGAALLGNRSSTEPAARRQLGYVPEDSPLYEDQTPLEYLAFFAAIHGIPRKAASARGQELLRRLRLDEVHWAKPIGQLSKGSMRKVALARALLHDPAVLVLDEPASGLDPATRRELDAVLADLRRQGKAILLSAHHLRQVEELCDRILLMDGGRLVAQGTLAELRQAWGTTRYRLLATVPFPGSGPHGTVHQGHPASADELEARMADVRAASGTVLEVESVPPSLEEILVRAAGALEARPGQAQAGRLRSGPGQEPQA